MVSLEEDPRDSSNTESVVENEVQWPATRGPSLDDEEDATNFASNVNVALQNSCMYMPAAAPAPEVLPVSQSIPPRWASIEDDEDLPEFMQSLARAENETNATEPFAWPATRGPSLDEHVAAPVVLNLESLALLPTPGNEIPIVTGFMPLECHDCMPPEFLAGKSSSLPIPSDASTTDSTDEDNSLSTPPSGLSDDEGETQKDMSGMLKISLTDTLGLWSVGSAAHETGSCKPCAFLWKDPKNPGCQNGPACTFCHLCPPGEVKARKKQKMFMRKVAKNLQSMDQYAMGFEPNFDPQYQNQYTTGYGMW